MSPEVKHWFKGLSVAMAINIVIVAVCCALQTWCYNNGKMAGRAEGLRAAVVLYDARSGSSWQAAKDSIFADWGIE